MFFQNVYDTNKNFWSVCARQPNNIHNGGQFKSSTLYK
jgi:hypothetical protein